MALVGARAGAQGTGLDELPGKVNYFLENDPRKWKTGIQTYSKVEYKAIYPSTDLIYYGYQGQIEGDFIVKPGGDPKAIRLSFTGIRGVRVDELTGDLVVRSMRDGEDIRLRRPVAYQRNWNGGSPDGENDKRSVEARYAVQPNGQVTFELGWYDRATDLVIDPVINFFSYLGGSQYDFGLKVAVDSAGAAYLTGATVSTNFPLAGAEQPAISSTGICYRGTSVCPDAFVIKLNASGTALVYSTYLGGTRSDFGTGIAVDNSGLAYVAGWTESTDFPVISTGYQTTRPSGGITTASAFLTKLSSSGSQLLYSSYLGEASNSGAGHSGDSFASAVAVDDSGNAYLDGYTRALDFPTTQNVLQPLPGGWSCSSAIASSSTFPNTFSAAGGSGSAQLTIPSTCVWTVTSSVSWITITSARSGSGDAAIAYSVAANASGFRGGAISIAGQTFFVQQSGTGSCVDGYPTGFLLSFGSAGGPGSVPVIANTGCPWNATSTASWIAITSGSSGSGNGNVTFSIAPNSVGASRSGAIQVGDGVVFTVQQGPDSCGNLHTLVLLPAICSDAFVSKINTNASGNASLVYSTYLGGSNYDAPMGIAIDSSGDAYVVGGTLSSDFPIVSASQSTFGGGECSGAVGTSQQRWMHACSEAFLAKLNPAGTALSFSTYLGGLGGDNAATSVALDSSGNAYVTGFTNSNSFPTTGGTPQTSFSAGSCSFGTASLACPDAFVAKFNSSGSKVYATYLGGTLADIGLAIATDSAGNAYITGTTISSNFPTASPLQTNEGGGSCTFLGPLQMPFTFTCPDIFVSKIDPTGATLAFSTYLGSSAADIGTGIAVDSSSNAYVTGATMSTGLGTSGAFQSSLAGKSDVFVSKIATGSPDFSVGSAPGGSTSSTVSAGNTATYNLQISSSDGFSGSVNLACIGAPSKATCTPTTSPVSVSSGANVPFIINVATTKSSLASPFFENHPSPNRSPWQLGFLIIFSLSALSFLWPLLAGHKPVRAYLHSAILLVGLAAFVTACSTNGNNTGTQNGNTGNPSSPGTPAGTYTLTLTATSGSLSHTQTLTLTVN